MTRALSSFVLIALLSAALAALSLAVAQKGYPHGAAGLRRLDGIASATTFIPIAALYILSALLLMILPMRAASFVLVHATDKLFWTAIALLAAIAGILAAKAAFGQRAALWALADWQFAFAAATIGCHFLLNELRRNVLSRSIGFVLFLAATLACLFWTFRF